MLSVHPVRRNNQAQFIRYVAAHGPEHDESYLPGAGFVPSDEHPAYLLEREGEVLGAVSLMRTARYRSVRRGRFSFFHSVDPDPQAYSLLFDPIRRHFDGLDSVYLFLPEGCPATGAVQRLGFTIERYSFVMKLDNRRPAGVAVPEGLALVPVHPSDGKAAQSFAQAINANFHNLAGHIPMRASNVCEWEQEPTYLDDGVALLMDGGCAVGTVSVMRDLDDPNAAEIGALSVDPQRRGQGLGRLLLRHAVCFASWRGLRPVYLSVNAENGQALRLYQAEGFVVTDTVACYAMDCRRRLD